MAIKRHLAPRIFLLVVLLFALGLRSYHFGQIPHGLNRDEASIGYTAYLLLHTGQDEYGRHWPFKFQSFGDWKLPGYIYLTVPFIYLFGLDPASVRLPSLIMSLAMIIAAYLLASRLSAKYSALIGLAAAFILALNPWHFHFSHLALEAMIASSLFATGVWLITGSNLKYQVLGLGFFSVAICTYHAALIVIPLWTIGYLMISRGHHRSHLLTLSIIIFLLFTGWILCRSWFSAERDKVSGTTIFTMTNEEQWQQIYRHRTDSLSAFYVNKYVYWSTTIIRQYLQTLSPTFLLTRGGTHPHYNVPRFGNFYMVEIALAALGLIVMIRHRSDLASSLLLALLLAPLPAAITKDAVHSTREVFLLPYVQVIAGLGFASIFSYLKSFRTRFLFSTLVAAGLIFQAYPFFSYYLGPYQKDSDRSFTGYMKDVMLATQTYQADYDRIYITFPYESPYIFYAFYTRLDPDLFHQSIEYYPADNYGFTHVSRLGSLYFPSTTKDLIQQNPGILSNSLVISRVEEANDIRPFSTISDLSQATSIGFYSGKDFIPVK